MKHIIILAIGLALTLPLQAGKKPAGGQDKAKANLAKVFKKKDKDGDSFLTKEEFIAKAKKPDKIAKAFARKDKNSDGKLSRAEFTGKKDKNAKKAKGKAQNKGGKKHRK